MQPYIDNQEPPGGSKHQAIKIVRYISIFGIGPALITIANVYLNKNEMFQPHGSTASILISYGVVVPLVVIVSNKKIKHFAAELIRAKVPGLD